MKIDIHFKKTKSSDELSHYTKEKIKRELEKFHPMTDQIEIIIQQEGLNYRAKCHIKSSNAESFSSEGSGTETHEAVDNMIKKIHSVLRKHKEKLQSRHKRKQKNSQYHDISFADLYHDDSDFFSIDSEELIKFEESQKKRKKSS